MGATAAVLVAGGAAFALSSATDDGGDAAGTAPDLGAGTGTGPGTGPGTAPGTTPGTTPGTAPEKTPGEKPGNGAGAAGNARFAPYIDTSLHAPYDMVAPQEDRRQGVQPGVRHLRRRLHPQVGRLTGLGNDTVARQIPRCARRAATYGSPSAAQTGSELGLACASADKLAAAYSQVIDQFKLTKVDFDIEGGALPNTAANTRRAQAITRSRRSTPAWTSPSPCR